MDFNDSGLPSDATIYRAFAACQENYKRLDPSMSMPNISYGVAQGINDYVSGDDKNFLICAALLHDHPEATYGIIEKQFGSDITNFLKQADVIASSSREYIADASDRSKLFFMAVDMVNFDFVLEQSEKLQGDFDKIKSGDTNVKLNVAWLHNILASEHFIDSIAGTTSCPALENAYAEKLEKVTYCLEKQQKILKELGIEPPSLKAHQYPDFDSTKILDAPETRAAYKIITTSFRPQPDEVADAVLVAEVLSTVPSIKEPFTIAASLLGVGMQDAVADDFKVWATKVGPEVADILSKHAALPQDMATIVKNASPEMKKVLLANTIVLIDDARTTIATLSKEIVDQTAQAAGAYRALRQVLPQLVGFVNYSQAVVLPFIAPAQAPELVALAAKEMHELKLDIQKAAILPPPKPKQKPAQPKP
jgi:hypothetical protein